MSEANTSVDRDRRRDEDVVRERSGEDVSRPRNGDVVSQQRSGEVVSRQRSGEDTTGLGPTDDGPIRNLLECDRCESPADTFSVVANETRLAILEELWRADDRPVRFSDLRRRVGMRDSAQFNYHLGKLTGQFVSRSDDGYDLKHAGGSVVRALLAGTFTEHPEFGPFDTGDACVACGGAVLAKYGDETFTLRCADCDAVHGDYPFPPGGLHDRDEAALLRAFDQRVRHLHCLAADGVCPECNGRMATHIIDQAATSRAEEGTVGLDTDVHVEHVCIQCRHSIASSIGLVLLDTAEVVSFYRDHGVDLTATPYWTLPWCVGDEGVDVLSRDPYEFEVQIALEDEILEVVLDESLTIVESAVHSPREEEGVF